jgi:hypothetical protein
MPQLRSFFHEVRNPLASTATDLLARSHPPSRRTSTSRSHPKSRIKSSLATPSSRILLSLCALAFFLPPCTSLSATPPSSADVEAAYLYNFGKFIDWPASPVASTAPFSICVVGSDEFGAALGSLVQNDTIKGRPIVARRLPSLVDADTCQILFLGSSEQPRIIRDLDALKDKPILTVSIIPGFIDRGGMIEFLVLDNRVRFAINLTPATRVHLTLSSELLKVALYVDSKPSQEGL